MSGLVRDLLIEAIDHDPDRRYDNPVKAAMYDLTEYGSDDPGAVADAILATPAGQRMAALETVYRFCATPGGADDVGLSAYIDALHLLTGLPLIDSSATETGAEA